MEEIARFLEHYPPFSFLTREQVQRVASAIQIEYFARGTDILEQGGPTADFLYIIRRGSVDLLRMSSESMEVVDTLGEGELFGFVTLIRGGPPILTTRAREEVLAYLLPKQMFHALRRDIPSFAQFFARSISQRLERALQAHHAPADPFLFQTRLRDLGRRKPICIAPDATVADAARLMRDHNISCVVVDQSPPGIITDRDLRNRVLAEERTATTLVKEVMSAPARTLPADSLVFEALLQMQEHAIHHLPIMEGSRVVGVVTDTTIIRRKSQSPLFLPKLLQRAKTPEDLRHYNEQVTATVGALLDSGARSSDIGRMVAVAHDALVKRLLHDAEVVLGPPPCPYAWLVLGSEGRYEQTLRTDQDNALIYADDAPPEAAPYFEQLAGLIVEQLVDSGFPRCPGDVMASNPQWRQPVSVWQRYFADWINMPDEEALLRVSIFFDYRQVYGPLDAAAQLRPVIAQAANQRVFLGRLARAALRQPAPLGLFRQLIVERHGEQRDTIDLKMRGTSMIVDIARLFALEAGVSETNTLARLRAAPNHSSLSQQGAEELIAAFELMSLLRLRHQYAQIQRGEPPTNYVSLGELSALERRELKEAIRVTARVQTSIETTFQVALMA